MPHARRLFLPPPPFTHVCAAWPSGSPAHQAPINQAEQLAIESDIKSEGLRFKREVRVRINNGAFQHDRYADAGIIDKGGHIVYLIQSGVSNMNLTPVSREMFAIMDMESIGVQVYFIGYKIRGG